MLIQTLIQCFRLPFLYQEVASNVLEGAHAPTAEPSLDSSAGAGAGSDGGSDQLKLDSHKSEEEVISMNRGSAVKSLRCS